jgi:hypothetical protein
MKYSLTCLFFVSGIAFAQYPNRASFAPIAGVTHYVLDNEAITGPSIGIRYLTREISSSRFSLFAGVTLRPNGFGYYQTTPFIYSDQSQPYRLQPPIYDGAVRASRFAFGLAFFGFDWRMYLVDGSVRPYVGIGAQMVSWSYSSTMTGTITPDAKAGLEVHLTSGFNAFAEGQYAFGMPTLYGPHLSRLDNLASFGLGISFAPRW